MARRKRAYLDDSDPDSSQGSNDEEGGGFPQGDEDQDTRAERELFVDPYQRKKRRRVPHDEEEEEDEGFGGRKRGGIGTSSRVNLNK